MKNKPFRVKERDCRLLNIFCEADAETQKEMQEEILFHYGHLVTAEVLLALADRIDEALDRAATKQRNQ